MIKGVIALACLSSSCHTSLSKIDAIILKQILKRDMIEKIVLH